jgi:hypothetical protein
MFSSREKARLEDRPKRVVSELSYHSSQLSWGFLVEENGIEVRKSDIYTDIHLSFLKKPTKELLYNPTILQILILPFVTIEAEEKLLKEPERT